MSIYLSKFFKEVRDYVYGAFGPGASGHTSRAWRIRVGIPRLVAEEAASAALGLLQGIHGNVMRHDDEAQRLRREALAATKAYYQHLCAENWAEFQRHES